MEISQERKTHLKAVVENMKTINIDEYNKYNTILKNNGFENAVKYVYGRPGETSDMFTHSKQNKVSRVLVNQSYPSRIDCPGSSWRISSKQVKNGL